MIKVITALERQLRIEEGRILSHSHWENQMKTFGKAATSPQPCDEEYVRQIKKALEILKSNVAP